MRKLFASGRIALLLAAFAGAYGLGGCAGCADKAEGRALSSERATKTDPVAAPREGDAPPPGVPADFAPSHPSTTTLASKVLHQLAVEKKRRQQVPLAAERVAAAFQKEGIAPAPLKQGLGNPIGATYCAMSQTSGGVAFTVCEYPSAEAAQAGREQSEKRYGPGGLGRKLFVNGQTLLIARPVVQTEEASAQAKAMGAIFAGLR